MTGRPISCFTLIKHSANALIPEAEEAMPELCGKLLEVCISKSSVPVKENCSPVRSRNVLILGKKLGVETPSRNTSIWPEPGAYFNVVVVVAALRVKLIEGLAY